MSSASDIHAFLINSAPDIQSRRKRKTAVFSDSFPLKLVGALTVRSKPLLHYPFYCSAFVDSVRGVNSMTLVSFVAERCVVTVCVWTPTVCEPFQHNNAMSVTPVDYTPYVRHTAEQCAERPTWLLQ